MSRAPPTTSFVLPVTAMLAVQVAVSAAVLSLSVTMPAVARDLGIDPKTVGLFTALTYAVAVPLAVVAARLVRGVGAVRTCQLALLFAALGLALNAAGAFLATTIAALLIGFAQGPGNPAASHILAQRVPRERFGLVFSIKQTGVPLGFALAGAALPPTVAALGWQGASLASAALLVAAIVALEPFRAALERGVAPPTPPPGLFASVRIVLADPALRVLAWSSLVYVVAQHTFTFYLVVFLYERHGFDLISAGLLLGAAQIVGTLVRLAFGWAGDRVPRRSLLAWIGFAIAGAALATGLMPADAPKSVVAAVVLAYGAVVISWNGVSIAEFAHLAPPGQTALATGVQTAFAYSGAVIGPPLFGLLAALTGYGAAFAAVAVAVLAAAILQGRASRRA